MLNLRSPRDVPVHGRPLGKQDYRKDLQASTLSLQAPLQYSQAVRRIERKQPAAHLARGSKHLFERRHVDGEAVLYVGLQQPVIGFVHLLDGDDLDVGRDVMFAAEVEHFLGFRYPADR